MLKMYLVLAAQAAVPTTPPLPLPDYAHDEAVAQAEARATAFHKQMDANADGYVSQVVMARYTAKLLKGVVISGTDATHPLPAQSRAFFAAADTDRDGRISLTEAVAAARRNFDLQDTNHDGVVTPVERMAFVMKMAKEGRTTEGVPILQIVRRVHATPETWSLPAQAAWSGTAAPVWVVLHAGKASMTDEVSLSVDLLATGGDVAVSPFLQATRGIGFEVRTVTRELVAPAELMPGSPPPPPLASDQLTALGRAVPFQVDIREKTRTIFPGRGAYRIRAIVTLFDPDSKPARYAKAISAPVTITVTP